MSLYFNNAKQSVLEILPLEDLQVLGCSKIRIMFLKIPALMQLLKVQTLKIICYPSTFE